MDQQLKQLMKELGEAINESLADSDQIAEVVTRIKEGGYDIFLVLEATIGFNRQDEKPSRRRPTIPAPAGAWALLGPDGINPSVVGCNPRVIPQKIVIRIKFLLRPGIVAEGFAAIRGTGEHHKSLLIFRVKAPVVEGQIRRA